MVGIIAEIGTNHEGSMEVVEKLIREAKRAGANYVKFQKRTIRLLPKEELDRPRSSQFGTTERDYRLGMEFGKKEYDHIDSYCKFMDIHWTASVWDLEAVDFLMQYDVPFIKIPSARISDMNLLLKVKKTGKPVILSTAMASEREVRQAVDILGNNLSVLMHCVGEYPTKKENCNINRMDALKEIFPTIGYSGHEDNIFPTVISVAKGAYIIERHITLDRSMRGSDQTSSLTPDMFNKMVVEIKKCLMILGKKEYGPFIHERKAMKRLKSKYNIRQ